MTKTVKYRITGRVQGVGFRWFTTENARKLGVKGTVKNCADGSVEVVAQADENTLTDFERKLNDGPSSARVDRFDAEELKGSKTYNNFEVVY